MVNIKKTIIIVMVLFLFSNVTSGLVTFYPGTEILNGNLTVGFSNPDGINVTYAEIGSDYVLFDDYNLSFTAGNAIEVNFSMYTNVSNLDRINNTLLRFNVTYAAGNVAFSFNNTNTTGNLIYYYYRDSTLISTYSTNSFVFSYNSWSTHDFEIEGISHPDPPYNGSSLYHTGTNTVNLTWNTGNYSDTNVVLMSTTGCPTPTSGTVVQNNTLEYYNFSVTGTQYYSIWSFNNTFYTFSLTGLCIDWGAIGISCFNESNPSEAIDFNLEISNEAGTTVYQRNDLTNIHYIDVADIPTGAKVHFLVSNSSYRSRERTETINLNNFYNFSFYLPLVEIPNNNGIPTGENYTRMYRVRVIDEETYPIGEAFVEVKKYINTVGVYEIVGSGYTNGYGEWDIWLIPSSNYKVFLTRNGFVNVTGQDWLTDPIFYGANFPKIFQMLFDIPDVQPAIYSIEDITFLGVLVQEANNTYTLQLSFSDANSYTTSSVLTVVAFNYTTNSTINIGTYPYGAVDWTRNIYTIDRNMTYYCNVSFEHTYLGTQLRQYVLETFVNVSLTVERIEQFFDWMGVIPFGAFNFIMLVFLIAGCYYADERDAGKIVLLIGVIFFVVGLWFVQGFILFDIADAIVPLLFIIMGVLMEWNQSKRKG